MLGGERSSRSDVAAVCHPDDRHKQFVVNDLVHDAVVADSNPVQEIRARQLLSADRPRGLRQALDRGQDAFAVGRRSKPQQLLARRGLERQAIARHGASLP